MKKLYTLLTLFCLAATFTQLSAQTYNDGPIYMEQWVGYWWVESGDDVTCDDEYGWRAWGADNADVDGIGFRPTNLSTYDGGVVNTHTSCTYLWVDADDYMLYNQQYGPAAGPGPSSVPQFQQLRIFGWEDDCFDCTSNGTICLGGGCTAYRDRYEGSCCTTICASCDNDDQPCGAAVISSTIPVRNVPPCGNYFVADYFTNTCGSDDVGAEARVYYTPPRPSTFTASTYSLCAGGGTVTLNMGGATFGGTYDVYNQSTSSFIATAISGPTYVLNVTNTTTFRLYARNGTCRSQGYLTLTVVVNSPLAGGVIGSDQTVCYSGDPAAFTSTSAASGGSGGFTYQWEYQDNCSGGWTTIPGATSLTYDPPTGASVTRCYHRAAINTCGTAYSNTITVTVLPDFNPGNVTGGGGALCSPANPAAMTVAPSGAAGTYTYQWYYQDGAATCPTGSSTTGWTLIGGATSATYDPPAGLTLTRTYAVQVNPTGTPDCGAAEWANTCVTVTIITVSTAPSSISGVSAICAGDPVTLTVVGGSLGIGGIWNWYTGSCGGTLIGTGPAITLNPLSTETYYVRAEDPCLTTACVSHSVTVNPLPNAYLTGATTVCPGKNAPVTVVFTGGAAPYSITITDGTTNYTRSGFNTGDTIILNPTASVNVNILSITDANGCTRTSGFLGGVFIAVSPSAMGITLDSVNHVNCFGGTDGDIYITPYDGDAPYTYSWSNGSTIEDQINVIAGTYTVTVTDASLNCSATLTTSITQPTELVLSIDGVDNVSCYGRNDGSIYTSTAGGVSSYSYVWSSGATTADLINVMAGNYTLTVTDANACIDTISVSITQPTQFNLSGVVANVTCNSGNNGSINLSVSGSQSPYTFVWSNGASTEDISSLMAGTYVVSIRDAGGCDTSISFVVSQPPALTIASSVTDILCSGASTGAIDLTISGGTPAYSFTWNDGATTEDRTSLTSGNYSVTVTDANLCTTTQSFTINSPSLLAASLSSTNVSCFGFNNGLIDVTVTGGVSPYSYSWNDGASTEDRSSLSPNTYSVTITDQNSCSASLTVTITEPTALTSTSMVTHVSCFGGNNGSIDLSVSGGTLPYTFLWSTFAVTEDISSLSAGIYTVLINDANGCFRRDSAIVTQPAAISINGMVTNVSCSGGNNGAVDITVSGGTAPYTFVWSNGATSEDVSTLTVGTYVVTVTDNNACTSSYTAVVTEPTILSLSETHLNVSCNGMSDGSVNLSVTGGTVPYTYLWNDGITMEDRSGLAVGAYTVTVTDNNSCTSTLSLNITQPTVLTANVFNTNVTCHGGNDAMAYVVAGGGTSPYHYLWSSFSLNDSITSIPAGSYSVLVTDANGCQEIASTVVTEPAPLNLVLNTTNVSCYGAADGSISVDVAALGGTMPYSYAWTPSVGTMSSIGSLSPGTYQLTVTDGNSCTISGMSTVTQPDSIEIIAMITNLACNNDSSGGIDITASGGTVPYTYIWSGGTMSSLEDLSNLDAGVYNLTLTDDNGCVKTASYTVSEPSLLSVSISSTNVICSGMATGSATANISGGTAPYNILWSNFETTPTIGGLSAGVYRVQVEDAHGCLAYASVTITEPIAMIITNVGQQNVSCFGGNNGSISFSVAGGVAPYTYTWSPALPNSPIVMNLAAGDYVVNVMDANGCLLSQLFEITQPDSIQNTVALVNPTCYTGNDGFIQLTTIGGVAPYTYVWNTIPIQTTNIASNLAAGNYMVTITDANNCTQVISAPLVDPLPITISSTVVNAQCAMLANGEVTIHASGGNPPYIYLLNGFSQYDSVYSNLVAGDYTVHIEDVNGCTGLATFSVSEPSGFTVDVVANQQTITLGASAVLSASSSDAVIPVSHYDWMPSDFVLTTCVTGDLCNQVEVNPNVTTQFTVVAYNSDSCTAYDTITIFVRTDRAVFIPTAFSPNGDGSNETFDFEILGAEQVNVGVYDRWGETVYSNQAQSNGQGQGWDGTYNGVPLPAGAYVYSFKVTYFDGTTEVIGGSISLIR